MVNKGIRLIAITYGIRRIIPDDTWLLPVCYFILSTPFIILICVMIWDSKTGQYDYAKIKADKKKAEEEKFKEK